MSIKDIQDIQNMMCHPVFAEIQEKLRDAADRLFPRPVPYTADYVEHYRAELQYQYDLLYEAGMIPVRPTVSFISFNPQTGDAVFDVDFPEPTIKYLLKYVEDETENSAIDSPLDKP